MDTKKETLLFLTRGNSLQVFDYQNEKVLHNYTLKDEQTYMKLKSFYSPQRKFYIVHGKKDFYVINSQTYQKAFYGDYKDTTLQYFEFLSNSEEYFYTVEKSNHQKMYIIKLYKSAPSFELIHTLNTVFFKSDFKYLSMSKKQNLLFYQASSNALVALQPNLEFKKKENCRICEDFNIHDFQVHDNFVYVINNNSVKDDKNKSTVKIFNIEDGARLFCKRSFKNVQELKMIHNTNYSMFIIHAQQYEDKTGKSYYGREKIFSLNYNTQKFEEIVTYNGVIHDAQIDHSEQKIVTISGKQPAHCILYDQNLQPFYMLTHDYKNQVYFSPQDKLVAVCAFGSLNGNIEIWDYQKRFLINDCYSSYSSFLKWSPDGKTFLTAIIVQKLKVDHRFTIFKSNGDELKTVSFDVFNLVNVDYAYHSNIVCEQNHQQKEKKLQPLGLVQTLPDKPGPINKQQIKDYKPQTGKTPIQQVNQSRGKLQGYKKKNNAILNKWKTPVQKGANFQKKKKKMFKQICYIYIYKNQKINFFQ